MDTDALFPAALARVDPFHAACLHFVVRWRDYLLHMSIVPEKSRQNLNVRRQTRRTGWSHLSDKRRPGPLHHSSCARARGFRRVPTTAFLPSRPFLIFLTHAVLHLLSSSPSDNLYATPLNHVEQ